MNSPESNASPPPSSPDVSTLSESEKERRAATKAKYRLRGISRKPCWRELRKIREFYGLDGDFPFPRCPAKSSVCVKACEKAGDFSHSSGDHAPCVKCRCKYPAGYRTLGWFYWPKDNEEDLKEVGHYGVGYCVFHEQLSHRTQRHAPGVARSGMKALMRFASADTQRFVDRTREEGQQALALHRTWRALDYVNNLLSEYEQQCKNLEQKAFTEKGKGGAMDMTDKSRVELALKIASSLSTIAEKHFKMDTDSYFHKSEIQLLIDRVITMTETIIIDKDQFAKWINGFKDALRSVRAKKG